MDISGGSLTSSAQYLNIYSSASNYHLAIYSPIVNSPSRSIGLRVRGWWNNTVKVSELWLHCSSGNTYTGDTIVEKGGVVVLCNLNASTSIQSRNLFVNNGKVFAYRSNQLRDDAAVYLSNTGEFNLGIDGATQKLRSLNVTDYSKGVLGFGISSNVPEGAAVNGVRSLFLDDLNIEWGSELLIRNWQSGTHRLFVLRSSRHLWDSLDRIRYEGKPLGWRGRTSYYDSDYYEIVMGTPEPSTYGAVLGAAGLVIVAIRRRKGQRWLLILPCIFEF